MIIKKQIKCPKCETKSFIYIDEYGDMLFECAFCMEKEQKKFKKEEEDFLKNHKIKGGG